jgi:hypothetical protein
LTEKLLFEKFPAVFQGGAVMPFQTCRNVFCVAFALLLMAGCATRQEPVVVAPEPLIAQPAAPGTLTPEALAALQAAEQSVIEARVRRALWTTAVEELNKARAAAKLVDSAATLAHAREAATLCELSIRQLAAPPVKW